MSSPSPAEGLQAGPTDHVHPNGKGSQNLVPFPSLGRRQNIRKPDQRSGLDSLLLEIIGLPKITGAAIALDIGNCFECQASCGQSAPPCGTRCYPGVGLTGTCLATREIQLCNDTDGDSRVDRSACQQLGVKSVLVVPIKNDSAIIGVLEALSSDTHVFDEQKLACITNLAERVALCAPQSIRAAARNPRNLDQERITSEAATHGTAAKRLVGNFDLQRILESAYVLQQHQDTLSARGPAVPRETIDQKRILGSDQPQASKEAEPAKQLCAVLSPVFYSFGERFLDEVRYRNLAVAVLFSAALLGPSFLIHYGKQSRSNHASSQPSQSVLPGAETQIAAANSTPRSESEEQPTKMVPQTYEAEMRMFEAAAKEGSADASWKLGLGYLKGIGVRRDENKAAQWFKKAANLGDTRAQTALSDFYCQGIGVPRDYVRAYTWASIASGGASTENAQNARLKALRPRMTSAQLEDANRRTAAWFAGKPKL
jgi:hypothetical protein